ncbi:hypothetical protein NHJ13734_007136 [Beauveria thailandica]
MRPMSPSSSKSPSPAPSQLQAGCFSIRIFLATTRQTLILLFSSINASLGGRYQLLRKSALTPSFLHFLDNPTRPSSLDPICTTHQPRRSTRSVLDHSTQVVALAILAQSVANSQVYVRSAWLTTTLVTPIGFDWPTPTTTFHSNIVTS